MFDIDLVIWWSERNQVGFIHSYCLSSINIWVCYPVPATWSCVGVCICCGKVCTGWISVQGASVSTVILSVAIVLSVQIIVVVWIAILILKVLCGIIIILGLCWCCSSHKNANAQHSQQHLNEKQIQKNISRLESMFSSIILISKRSCWWSEIVSTFVFHFRLVRNKTQ